VPRELGAVKELPLFLPTPSFNPQRRIEGGYIPFSFVYPFLLFTLSFIPLPGLVSFVVSLVHIILCWDTGSLQRAACGPQTGKGLDIFAVIHLGRMRIMNKQKKKPWRARV